jgi:hypothetical protein
MREESVGRAKSPCRIDVNLDETQRWRRVSRTATVRAATDLRLHTLTSNRFLPIVTGFPPSAREAGTSVDLMLHRFNPGAPPEDRPNLQS